MMGRLLSILLPAALLAAAGCFKEPVPATQTVPAEARVYLKDAGLSTLTVDAVYEKGLVYLNPEGPWTNLSARVTSFDPASIDYLNLDYNELTNLGEVASFTSLKWLRLNANKLSDVPDLSALTNLKRLYLKGNLLRAVPETLKPGLLPNLDTVDLSSNPITSIPDWFAQREGLAHLSLTNTGITKLPADLSAWRSLKSLQLAGLNLESREELKRIRAALPSTAIVF